jgi:hypothetical protein
MSYQTAFTVRPKPIQRAEAPVYDPAYLRFIRGFPCAVCGRRAEAAHTGPHGLSDARRAA